MSQEYIRNAMSRVGVNITENERALALSRELLGSGAANTLQDRIEQNIQGSRLVQAGLLIASGEILVDEAIWALQVPEARFNHGGEAGEQWNELQERIKARRTIKEGEFPELLQRLTDVITGEDIHG